MNCLIFWLEGVDFRWSINDTNDLSTIRGGSLLLMDAISFAENFFTEELSGGRVSIVSSGASRSVLKLCADNVEDIENRISAFKAKLVDPKSKFSAVRFVVGKSEPYDGAKVKDATALLQAESQARIQQYQTFSLEPAFDVASEEVCAIDGVRSASSTIKVPSGNEGRDSEKIQVSKSVEKRRSFGRAQRQKFYRSRLNDGYAEKFNLSNSLDDGIQARFCDSFQDIVADAPKEIPLSATSKIAVFYADGNKFGKVRQRLCENDGAIEGNASFSEKLVQLQNEHLLPAVLDVFKRAKQGWGIWDDNRSDETIPRYRFETLLWGGDEVRFVMPAWMGMEFARAFFECVSGDRWTMPSGDKGAEEKLTFSASLVFASCKTPIRSLVKMGDGIVDVSKQRLVPDKLEHQLSIEVLESLAPPSGDISEWRRMNLGLQDKIAPAAFVFQGQELIALRDNFSGGEALPRSQLYKLLNLCRSDGYFNPNIDDKHIIEAVDSYASKSGKAEILTAESLRIGAKPLALSLMYRALLHDYIYDDLEMEAVACL